MKKRKDYWRNVKGLKKWNKIVSVLVKDYKKQGIKYDLKDVRKLASNIYSSNFKEVTPSKLRVKDIIEANEKVIITALDIDQRWFNEQDKFARFWQVGQWASNFSNTFPMIPVMLITKQTQDNPLVVVGATGTYQGSVFQEWVEQVREELENRDEDYSDMNIFIGTPAYANSKDKTIYAVWYENGSKIPKVPPKPTQIEPRKKIIVQDLEERRQEQEEKEPRKKRGRPKKDKTEPKKPLPKQEKKPLSQDDKRLKGNREKEIQERNIELAKLRQKELEMARKDYDDGIYNKKEYKAIVKEIMSKYSQGGLI
jgi:hypothetical protein